ncbi:hypothetical protein J2D73_04800 [Acetobacter sacchari]|uniref:Uncharacterized protein n=1 Tax=Acetobacter sacchari TaxID=2661687 RepID=A0ABS3LT74_9PROT|nr:hypothetical protein [Acetobacter sacchari]MBO1359115.1 hypothetical protein [Acetobacter sacchari]
MFPVLIPSGQAAVALDGYVETGANSKMFSEALISLHVSNTPSCPKSGQDLGDYPQINKQFPSYTLMAEIVKQASIGNQVVQVHMKWNPPIPLSKCLYIVMDGSDFVGNPYRMSAQLRLTTVNADERIRADIVGVLSDEFLMSPQRLETAYKVFHVIRDMELTELYGNVVAIAGEGAANRIPSGAWHVIHSVYIQRGGCPQFPTDGMYTDNQTLDKFIREKNTERLHSVTLHGLRNSHPNLPFYFAPVSPIALRVGDCVIHGVSASGPEGKKDLPDDGINTESQIGMEVVMK